MNEIVSARRPRRFRSAVQAAHEAGAWRRSATRSRAAATILCIVVGLSVTSCGGGGGGPTPSAQTVSCPTSTSTDPTETQYRLTFQANWSSSTFPTNFPGGAHFSPLVGAVHDSGNEFWSPNNRASSGIESMAEVGGTGTLVAEINARTPTTSYTGSGIGSTGTTSINFRVSQDCPLVTFVSMVAPSHDWFVGVTGEDLRDGSNQFVDKTVNLVVWDAGTEDGTDFSLSGTADTNPQGIIELLTTDSTATDFTQGTNQNVYIGTFSFAVTQAATAALPRLTAAPATIAEGDASTVTVALAEAAPAGGMPLTLTFGGTAGGDDYRASAARVTIPAGATTATFTMTALRDEIADPVETIIITANGASTTATTTVTIEGESALTTQLNRVILPEVARAIADTTVTAITRRLNQAKSGHDTAALTLGGQSTPADMLLVGGRTLAETGTVDVSALPGHSSFVLPFTNGGGPGGRVAVWGGGDYRSLGGSGGAVDWDGDLFSAHLGVDTRLRNDLLAGLAVSWSQGEFDYLFGGRRGDYELALAGIHPYVSWMTPDERLDVWVTAGYGWGEMEIVNDAERRYAGDVEMQTVGAGGSGHVWKTNATTLRLKGEVSHTKMDVEGGDHITAMTVEARRVRMTMEGTHTHVLVDGARLAPTVEVGVRHDAGDGRTGTGAEVGGGLRYTDAARSLTLESRGRALLGHNGGYEDWGLGGIITLNPGAIGHGLFYSLEPTWGDTAGRVLRLWAQDHAAVPMTGTHRTPRGRLEMRLGYGLGWDETLVTPYGVLTLTDGRTRFYRLGSRLRMSDELTFSLEGLLRETVVTPMEHGVRLKVGLNW